MKRARALLAAGLIVASCLAAPPAISWLRGAESLLALAAGGPESCDAARELADEKIAELDRRIADLLAMRDSLGRLAATCVKPRNERDCPLLQSIQEAADER